MIGAIAGDIIGSVYEWHNIKTKSFELFDEECFFTDDTVLTVALADAIIHNKNYGKVMKEYYQSYPDAGYGSSFKSWAVIGENQPYNSWGNGSAMRTSPVGFLYDSLSEVLDKAEYFASFTHNHPEGIKGAKATSAAIFLSRTGSSKADIKSYITKQFDYDLSTSIDEIRPEYSFDVSCQGSVPQAITAFLESTDYEDAIRNAISIGGDSDTLACIAGGIAEAFYGVPKEISAKSMSILDYDLREVVREFYLLDIKNDKHT
jgi:ADP-ribosylglycohydrolase